MSPRTEVSHRKNKLKMLPKQHMSQYKNLFLTKKNMLTNIRDNVRKASLILIFQFGSALSWKEFYGSNKV